MIKLEKGAKVMVRRRDGNVYEAFCYSLSTAGIHVFVGKELCLALNGINLRSRQGLSSFLPHECRLIGPPCVLVPVGVSV